MCCGACIHRDPAFHEFLFSHYFAVSATLKQPKTLVGKSGDIHFTDTAIDRGPFCHSSDFFNVQGVVILVSEPLQTVWKKSHEQ